MEEKCAELEVERVALKRKIICLEEQQSAINVNITALKNERWKLRTEQIVLQQTMKLEEFENRLKSTQAQESEHKLDLLIALLCEIRNHFNAKTFIPVKSGSVWTTIEKHGRKSISVAWRFKQNGDAYRRLIGKIVHFNLFTVTMDILKVELRLKMQEISV